MASFEYLRKKHPGTTKRIIATVVREDELGDNTAVDIPANALRFWNEVIAVQPDYEPHKESVCVIMVSARHKPIAWNRVSLGTLTQSECHPREVFRPVILAAADSFILLHNHPSGNCTPSNADAAITRRIVQAAEIMQINFLDHLVVPTSGRPLEPGLPSYYSFREGGLIP